jgi:hypothetical protein
LGLRVV